MTVAHSSTRRPAAPKARRRTGGPDGFTAATRAFEFRAGGAWDFVMHGPDGTHWMRTVFPTRELRDRAAEQYHAIEGGRQTLRKLADYATARARDGAGT